MRYFIAIVLLLAVLAYGLAAGKAVVDNAAEKLQHTTLVQ